MKKKALSFLLAIILTITLLAPMQSSAETTVNVKVDNVDGYISQFVDVKVSMATNMDISVGTLVINYDPRLELVSFTNGTVFENTYSEVTGEENGTFSYVGDFELSSDKTTISAKTGDVILTLKFRIPDTATITDSFKVSVVNAQSDFATSKLVDGEITAQRTPVIASSGLIGAMSAVSCTTHTYSEPVIVRTASYLVGGYSYKACSTCGYVEGTSVSPKQTNVFTPLGTAIRYAGNPSGIGAHFGVDVEAIKAVETAGYSVEIGIELAYGDRLESHVFYGANTPLENKENFEDGVISAAIEGVPTQKKGTICAYVKIIDDSGVARVERTYTSLHGNENISIVDVVSVMNFNKYSEASRDYLNAVANGFIE